LLVFINKRPNEHLYQITWGAGRVYNIFYFWMKIRNKHCLSLQLQWLKTIEQMKLNPTAQNLFLYVDVTDKLVTTAAPPIFCLKKCSLGFHFIANDSIYNRKNYVQNDVQECSELLLKSCNSNSYVKLEQLCRTCNCEKVGITKTNIYNITVFMKQYFLHDVPPYSNVSFIFTACILLCVTICDTLVVNTTNV
jgi:hypothetical protein